MIKILLADYLKDPSDMRLDILCANLNPAFKLIKSNKSQIKLMIEDYSKDPSKQRLKILTTFIGGVTAPKSLRKIKSKMEAQQNQEPDEYIIIQKEMAELNKQIVDAKGDKMIINALANPYKMLEARLEVAIRDRDRRMLAQLDPVKIEKEMILKLFGNPEDVTSHAYKILNGYANDFQMQMNPDPTVMIKKLFAHNGKEPYEYSAGLVNAQSRIWRITKGGALASYDMGNHSI